MKKALSVLVIIVFLFAVFTSVHAEDDDNKDKGILDHLLGLPNSIGEAIFSFLSGGFIEFINMVYGTITAFITTNPDINLVKPIYDTIVFILSSFFGLLFTITGIKFLIGGYNFESRADAKKWLQNIFILIVILNISFYVYQVSLDFGTATATALWDTNIDSYLTAQDWNVSNVIFLGFFSFAVVIGCVGVLFRYFFVMFNALVFPIAIFMYFIPPIKGLGKVLIEFSFGVIVMQIFDVLVLVIGYKLFEGIVGTTGLFGMAIAFLMLFLVNTILTIIFLLHGVISVLDKSPATRFVTSKGVPLITG